MKFSHKSAKIARKNIHITKTIIFRKVEATGTFHIHLQHIQKTLDILRYISKITIIHHHLRKESRGVRYKHTDGYVNARINKLKKIKEQMLVSCIPVLLDFVFHINKDYVCQILTERSVQFESI